jgi:hypothetical protein
MRGERVSAAEAGEGGNWKLEIRNGKLEDKPANF